VWVHASWRRRGAASRLLDAARHTLLFGAALPRSACAFTAPTDDGRAFAVRYCGTPSFLLFHP
jgi:N-acetyltransferase